MSELVQGNPDEKTPLPFIEDVGKEFVEWAEKYWGMKEAYDKPADPNSESASWETVKPYFVNKINELTERKRPEKYPPGFYKLNIIQE